MEKKWTAVIKPKRKMFSLNLKEVMKYKDLIWLFVKRDIKTRYKQTVLGPLWFIIQPLMTSVIHTLVFGTLAGIAPGGVPQYLFYLAGSISWGLFAGCLNSTSNTFVGNAGVFGKVYFPRLTTPIATVMVQMFNFLIQFGIFMVMSLIFFLAGESFEITWVAALLPVLMIQMALLGMGFGIIISSLTTKYRDLQVLVGFGVSLWMYVTPVVYAANTVSQESAMYQAMMINPVSPIIEIFKCGWLGPNAGSTPWMYWGISWIFTIVVVIVGIMIFNKIEKNFMDTV